MELLQLAYFRVVARLEHMTRAAEELNVTQPSLSRAITRLEEEVGVPLFDRQGRGIRLNQFGTTFLEHVERVFRELDGATTELRDMRGLAQGSVSVAAGSLFWLPLVLKPFLADHPAVLFRLRHRSLTDMARILEDGEIDFCLGPAGPPTPRARWHHLVTTPIWLVVPSSHRFAGRARVALAELADEEMVLGKPGDVMRLTMDDYFRQVGITPRLACEEDEPAAMQDYVTAGLGVAFMSEVLQPRHRHPGTAWVPIVDPACALTVGIAWNRDRYLSLAARAFRQHLVSVFAAAPPDAAPSA